MIALLSYFVSRRFGSAVAEILHLIQIPLVNLLHSTAKSLPESHRLQSVDYEIR